MNNIPRKHIDRDVLRLFVERNEYTAFQDLKFKNYNVYFYQQKIPVRI